MKEKKEQSKSKLTYTAPSLEITVIEMESGIAAGSASLSPGDQGTPNNPGVTDRNSHGDIGGGTNSFDF